MFLKHVGKQGDKKLVVVYREIPNEEHMALVVFTETLAPGIYEPLMEAVESEAGQNTADIYDVLWRARDVHGNSVLKVLHAKSLLKKVATNTVILTPTAKDSIRLSELNTILNDMVANEEAAKRLKDLDENRGMVDPKAKRMADDLRNSIRESVNSEPATEESSVSVEQVGANTPVTSNPDDMIKALLESAAMMEERAKEMIKVSKELKKSAKELTPKPPRQSRASG